MAKIDKDAYQRRLEKISELFTDMVAHAEKVSQFRCPYRNKADRCTAEFRCRNQKDPGSPDEPFICSHDGTFDHRTAWETKPSSRRRAKQRIRDIKSAAAQKRQK